MHHIDVMSFSIRLVYRPSFYAVQEDWENYGTIHCTFNFYREMYVELDSLLQPSNSLGIIWRSCIKLSIVCCWRQWSLDIWIGLFWLVSVLCISWPMSWDPEGGLYINMVFLRLIFCPNTFVNFEKWVIISHSSWWLRITKAVSSANMSSQLEHFWSFPQT